jgi:hypothetical protein
VAWRNRRWRLNTGGRSALSWLSAGSKSCPAPSGRAGRDGWNLFERTPATRFLRRDRPFLPPTIPRRSGAFCLRLLLIRPSRLFCCVRPFDGLLLAAPARTLLLGTRGGTVVVGRSFAWLRRLWRGLVCRVTRWGRLLLPSSIRQEFVPMLVR